MSDVSDFEAYWKGFYKPTGQPPVFDQAMKEMARAAFEAGRRPVEDSQVSQSEHIASKLGVKLLDDITDYEWEELSVFLYDLLSRRM